MSQKNIAEIFNDIVNSYEKNHSQEMSNLIIAHREGFLYLSEIGFNYLKEGSINRESIIEQSQTRCDENQLGGFVEDDGEILGTEDIALVYINTQKADNYFGEPKVTATYDNVFFLDHEMGHFLADDETISQHISESISDAHASLRHVARFGNNTNYFENLINDVSLRPIFSSKFHYTVGALSAVDRLKTKVNISKIPESDLIICSNEIGRAYAYDDFILDNIEEAYYDAFMAFTSNDVSFTKQNGLEVLVNTMLENKDDENIYRAGKLYLQIDFVKDTLKEFYETNKNFWDKSFAQMKKHEEKSGFVLNASVAMDNERHGSAVDKIANSLINRNPKLKI